MRVDTQTIRLAFDQATPEHTAEWLAELRFSPKDDVLRGPFALWLGVDDFEEWSWCFGRTWTGDVRLLHLTIPELDNPMRIADLDLSPQVQAIFRMGRTDGANFVRVPMPVTRWRVFAPTSHVAGIQTDPDFFFGPKTSTRIKENLAVLRKVKAGERRSNGKRRKKRPA